MHITPTARLGVSGTIQIITYRRYTSALLWLSHQNIQCKIRHDIISPNNSRSAEVIAIKLSLHSPYQTQISQNLAKSPIVLKLFTERSIHDDVIKWKHFPRYWLLMRRIHQALVNSPRKGPIWRHRNVTTTMLCTKCQKDWTNEMGVMDEQDLARSDIEINLRGEDGKEVNHVS